MPSSDQSRLVSPIMLDVIDKVRRDLGVVFWNGCSKALVCEGVVLKQLVTLQSLGVYPFGVTKLLVDPDGFSVVPWDLESICNTPVFRHRDSIPDGNERSPEGLLDTQTSPNHECARVSRRVVQKDSRLD